MTHGTIKCVALLGAMALCLSAFAQDNEKLETGEAVPRAEQAANRLSMESAVGGSYQFKSDIDNGGNVAISRFKAGVGLPMIFNDQWALTSTFKYQLDSYDFGGGVDPWHNVNTLSGVALLQYRLGEHWLLYGGPILRAAAESGADWGNAIQGGGVVAVNYVANDQLSIGGGLVAVSQIEKDATVLPVFTARWKFAEGWKATLGFTDLATAGYGAEVSWNCCEHWQLSFGGQFHQSRFRIEGSGPSSNGVGQEKAFTLNTAATWSPNRSFSGTAFVGLATGGKIELDASNGNELGNNSYDAAPIIGVKAVYRF